MTPFSRVPDCGLDRFPSRLRAAWRPEPGSPDVRTGRHRQKIVRVDDSGGAPAKDYWWGKTAFEKTGT